MTDQITIPDLSLPAETLSNAVCCGFEGGIGYWARLDEYTINAARVFDYEGLVAGNCTWILHDIEDGGVEGLKLDQAAILRGVAILARKYPHHFAAMLDDCECDSDTGDALIQCALLGDIVYG